MNHSYSFESTRFVFIFTINEQTAYKLKKNIRMLLMLNFHFSLNDTENFHLNVRLFIFWHAHTRIRAYLLRMVFVYERKKISEFMSGKSHDLHQYETPKLRAVKKGRRRRNTHTIKTHFKFCEVVQGTCRNWVHCVRHISMEHP